MGRLGTRAIMERLFGRLRDLVNLATRILDNRRSRDEVAVGWPAYASFIYHPDLLELTRPFMECNKNGWHEYDWHALFPVAACNSVNELSPELFRLVEAFLPWFEELEPECKGAKCLRIDRRKR